MRALAFALLASTAAIAQGNPSVLQTGFDRLAPGEIHRVELGAAILRAEPGHAEIQTAHHLSHPNALHLVGGEDRSVILELPGDPEPLHELTFRAERWTSRAPFAFRIDAQTGSGWRTVWHGDQEVRVGHFQTSVLVPLAAAGPIAALRFVSTAPTGGGVLIDDLELLRPAPMRITATHQRAPAVPVLVGGADDPILEVVVDASGSLEALTVARIDIDLGSTDELGDLRHLRLEFGGPARTAALGRSQAAATRMTFGCDLTLAHGRNLLRVLATAADGADIDRRVGARCVRVVLADGRELEPELRGEGPPRQRLGIALRRGDQDGVDTCRIPGLVQTRSGTLIAAFDLRHESSRDLPGDIDVGVRRSTDGGRSWAPLALALDMGEPQAENGVGDPCMLVDAVTGRVWLFALWCRGNTGWNGSRPGLEPGVTGQLVASWSDDDGASWAPPRNLTRSLKAPAWRLFLQGPGTGITTRDGSLVVPAQYRDGDGIPHSTVIWSDDRGASWQVGSGARPQTTESQVVELADGSWMLNMRDNRGGARAIAITRDRGETWAPHPSSRGALPEPVCMASLIRFERGAKGPADDFLLFSNPAVDAPPRRRITIRASRDDGATWSDGVLLDEGRCAGYSSLARIDADTVGILYEGSRAQLVFQRVPVTDTLPTDR